MGHDAWALGVMEYGSLWRNSRRVLHEFLNLRAVTNLDDYQRKHAHRLLLHLVESPSSITLNCRFLRRLFHVCFIYNTPRKCDCGAHHGGDVRNEHHVHRGSLPASSRRSGRGHKKGFGPWYIPCRHIAHTCVSRGLPAMSRAPTYNSRQSNTSLSGSLERGLKDSLRRPVSSSTGV